MKIAALLGVKDEVELIQNAIEHLECIGVDQIIVYDEGSTDGTLDVLDQFKKQKRIDVVQGYDANLDGPENLARYVALLKSIDADWVMSIDADEFLLPLGGNLKTCADLLDDTIDFVSLPRRNVVLNQSGGLSMQWPVDFSDLSSIDVFSNPIKNYWANPDLQKTVPWIRSEVMPKMIGRRNLIDHATDGIHALFPKPGDPYRYHVARNVFIAHVPFSSLSRFYRKASNIDALMKTHESEFATMGFHWVLWRNLYRAGRIDEEFSRQMVTGAEKDTLRAAAMISSAKDYLMALAGQNE